MAMRFTLVLAFAVLGLLNTASVSAQIGTGVQPKDNYALYQREMDLTNKQLARSQATRNIIQINSQTFDKYVGTYEITPVGIFHFSREDNRYFVLVTGTGALSTSIPAEIVPESQNTFYAKDIQQEFEFISDRRGQVIGTKIYGFLRDGNFPDGVYLKKVDRVAAEKGEQALKAHVNSHVPDPEMAAALQRAITGFMKGQPIYGEMTPEFAKQTRQFLSDYPDVLTQLGAFLYLNFERSDTIGADLYEVAFANARTEWRIMPLAPDGKIFRITFLVKVYAPIAPISSLPHETSTKPRFIGSWQNAHAGGRCQFFPPTTTITLANGNYIIVSGKVLPVLPSSNVPGRENQIYTRFAAFILINDNEMIYDQAGPDGRDQCRFVRSDADKISPQP